MLQWSRLASKRAFLVEQRVFASSLTKTSAAAAALFTAKVNRTLEGEFASKFTESSNDPKDIASQPAADLRLAPQSLSASAASGRSVSAFGAFLQPGRTYREELYASRRFELTPTQAPGSALRKLQTLLNDEAILQTVKARRQFTRPGLLRHAQMYAGRRKKFDRLVAETIQKCLALGRSKQ